MSPVTSTSCLHKATCDPGKVSSSKTTHRRRRKFHDPNKVSFYSPKGHPLSAGVRVVLVIVRGVWSNACIPLGFDFWFPKLPHHLEEGQWLFGWLTGPICQCLIRFLPNPGFSIIKYKEGHGVKERPTYFFTWVPPEPDDQQSITGPHRAQNHHPKGSGYTGSQDAYWPVFYSHTSQQIYHLRKLGLLGEPRDQANSGSPLQSLTQKVNPTCSRTVWKFRRQPEERQPL